jgi:hypothetical protein
MADRRMFSKRIVRSAKFLKMPVSSRELYWQLGIEADDDGIVEAFNTMRITGATEDDLRVLASKGFVQVLNEDLVTYILDWNENNKLRADRKVDSIYKNLLIQVNPAVQLIEPKPRADTGKITGRPMDGIGKDRIVEVREVKEKVVEEKEPYFANAELNALFSEFIEVRKKLKAVNSDRAIKTLINKLNKYPDDVKYQMIENSIVNSWKDVYELKEKRTTSYQKPIRQEEVPEWINKEIKKEEMTQDELDEMDELLKPFTPNPDLQQRLKEKYGKKNSL